MRQLEDPAHLARFPTDDGRLVLMILIQCGLRLGDACKRTAIESGLAGGAPGEGPTYIAMGHMYFDSVADFQTAFGPHAKEILGDIPNFTNVQPTVQISDVIE